MANDFKNLIITQEEWDKVKVAGASVRPNAKSAYGAGLNAEETKKLFDQGPELIKDRFNQLVNYAKEEEDQRSANEEERKKGEQDRTAAEKARQSTFEETMDRWDSDFEAGESARQNTFDENEAERQTAFESAEAERNQIVGDLGAALDKLHNYAQALIGGSGS